ncbi:Uncharacterized protein Tcan_03586 [Toxocara canis]|uniref:Kanadaptin n=1 Tax=Toxocara canis TaxID=6265 RepID=A0A0B2V9P0_TOXCA|nr:Uncharacterized protein Tcan_03586 [Toxocara canis]
MEEQSANVSKDCGADKAETRPNGGDSTHAESNGPSTHSDGDNLTSFRDPNSPAPHSHHSVTSSHKDARGEDATTILSLAATTLDYKPPPWAIVPSIEDHYGLDIIKNGTLVQSIDFAQRKVSSFLVIGRLPCCDIQLDHPSISRYHCILQYGDDLTGHTGRGWHMYDLGSTHGTKLNKQHVPSKRYVRIRVGHVMQFGGSTRIMVLTGPSTDVEKEWEYSPTEMRKLKESQKLEEKLRKEAEKEMLAEKSNDDEGGISWGMEYDEEQAYAQATEGDFDEDREAAYRDDPLKALSHFFDREGFDMNFTFSESGMGHTHKWTCYIELPVDTAAGQSLSASATCSGSKKEAQTMCALNACRTLDMHGVLYRSRNEARKKAKTLAENDFYDSDEDTFFDRTGQIEKSRESRRKRAMEARGESSEVKETYGSLLKKITMSNEEMEQIKRRLEILSGKEEDTKADEGDDELDAFCRHLEKTQSSTDNIETKAEKSHLRQRLVELKHEVERMEKLAKIAKPVALPALKVSTSNTESEHDVKRAAGTISSATMNKLMMMRRSKAAASREKEREREVGMQLPPSSIKEAPFVAEVEEEDEPVPTSSTEVMKPSESKPQPSKLEPEASSDKSQRSEFSPKTSGLDQQISAQIPQPSNCKLQASGVELEAASQKPQSSQRSRLSTDEAVKEVDEMVNSVDEKVMQQKEDTDDQDVPEGCQDGQPLNSAELEVDEMVNSVDEKVMQQKEDTDDQDVPEGCQDGQPLNSAELVVKRRRIRTRAERTSTKASVQAGEYGEGCANRDEEYATWMPPDDQLGDGTTALNAKFAGRY